jgi:hypothetical protein
VTCFDATPWTQYANEPHADQLRFARSKGTNFTASLVVDVAKTFVRTTRAREPTNGTAVLSLLKIFSAGSPLTIDVQQFVVLNRSAKGGIQICWILSRGSVPRGEGTTSLICIYLR